eukprot:3790941-Pleurochrysis_carterae.AAC.1
MFVYSGFELIAAGVMNITRTSQLSRRRISRFAAPFWLLDRPHLRRSPRARLSGRQRLSASPAGAPDREGRAGGFVRYVQAVCVSRFSWTQERRNSLSCPQRFFRVSSSRRTRKL